MQFLLLACREQIYSFSSSFPFGNWSRTPHPYAHYEGDVFKVLKAFRILAGREERSEVLFSVPLNGSLTWNICCLVELQSHGKKVLQRHKSFLVTLCLKIFRLDFFSH